MPGDCASLGLPSTGSSICSASTASSLPTRRNPLRAAGPFGDKSVVEWPEYTAPGWLGAPAAQGPEEWLELRCRRLVARVPVLLYRTPEPPGRDAPLLVVHDGPEYARYSALTRFLDVASAARRIPPLTAALIQPIDRNETYSASALYAGALARELLPELAQRAPARPARRHGGEPRRAGDAPCAPPSPEDVRRAVPAIGQLLPAALGQGRVVVPALPANHAVRRDRAAW